MSDNGRNVCNGVHPAFPLDPPSGRNFGTERNVPSQFLKSVTPEGGTTKTSCYILTERLVRERTFT